MPSESWVFFLVMCVVVLVKHRLRCQTLRQYEARNQFECRVRSRGTGPRERQGQWVRALATPYPDRLTLQLLEGSAANGAEPVTVLRSGLTGVRAARISEALLRFRSLRGSSWHIASYRGGAGEIDVAAPSSHLEAVTGRGTGSGHGAE